MAPSVQGVQVGRVFGAPIYLRSSWFIFMAVVVVGYAYYLNRSPLVSLGDALTVSATVAFTVAFAVFCHELAHAAVGVARGQRVSFISLTLWGGLTKLTQGSPTTSLLVSLAGPVVNLIFALLGYVLVEILPASPFRWGLHLASDANLAIFVFNLLPSYPLDGGHAVEAFVHRVGGLKSRAVRVTAWCGVALIPALAGFAVVTGWLSSLFSVVILIYVASYLWRNAQAHLKVLKQQAVGHDPLLATNLMRPAAFF
ncbi:site-2 protease family protein [Rothia sp. ZJ932]|uniref:site-2 protease family protein n=1 Tax=Rothia sp. ZJ932 TaxID=2810516 RepID=UPI0019673D4D|nr:site-2 protease family protein [Rothia sp. ZJ932]QRZ60756.1 hypothetical protein JR346_05530 [Rothia sp. ZJ932]